MRCRIFPLILSIASLGVTLATGTAAVDSDSQPLHQSEEETRALRQSLFKKPAIPLSAVPLVDPQPRIAPRAPKRVPASRRLEISPPPAPRDFTLAERELSLQPAGYTPYDRYSGSVRTVIARLDERRTTMARAGALMKEAHSFRYRTSDPYRAALPETTAATRSGDCKGKSLWLYDQLGDPSALYVIGKTFRGTKSNHAWIYWRCDSRWWILDPTNRSAPVAADTLPNDRYVPYYSFGTQGAFRHRSTWIFMAGAPPVATPGGKARVARQ